ncbi:MAG TPA: glycogen debranching protein GlgX [Planctomycetota bacterium]
MNPREPLPGRPFPLGATLTPGGVNFSVFSKSAEAIELCLFDVPEGRGPSSVVLLDPRRHRSFHYWHVFLPGLKAGQIYGWRTSKGGPLLLDPYARATAVPKSYDRMARGDNAATAMKSVVADIRGYDWEGDAPLRRPFAETIIYEMHVKGFTASPSSKVPKEKRGTYAGLTAKIPYLKDLGVTAVELMPVFQFDPYDAPPGRVNYWGYAPVSYFSPHLGYASTSDPLGALTEFRDMVKAFHRAGLEVILDVVYNHTAEGDERGPTFSFKGLENAAYYILENGGYANYSGCGNTLNANHPVTRRMILDSLRYWVQVMHVDGFRFDLAAILARDDDGRPLRNPPVILDIESDPVLAGTKFIAEAWDAAGLYQVGSFVGDHWKEWNGRFRDDVRSFVKGDDGSVGRLAPRLLASPDVFAHEGREAEQSVNFVTCHDGFTLNDLVSYDRKHNEANGEENRDGTDQNQSWNCGVEGPSDDPAIEALRERQAKNLLAINLLALGAPMLLMGDEARRTQGGNNNAYAQDNETSWFDWTLVDRNAGLRRFVKGLIEIRRGRDIARPAEGATLERLLRMGRIEWHGVEPDRPDWSDASRSISVTTHNLAGTRIYHWILSAYWKPLDFRLPPPPPGAPAWRRLIDTSLAPPDDLLTSFTDAPAIMGERYAVGPRSVVLLVAEVEAG